MTISWTHMDMTASRRPAGEAARQWIAGRVDDHMDFRREPATRAADGLIETLLLRAPALC